MLTHGLGNLLKILFAPQGLESRGVPDSGRRPCVFPPLCAEGKPSLGGALVSSRRAPSLSSWRCATGLEARQQRASERRQEKGQRPRPGLARDDKGPTSRHSVTASEHVSETGKTASCVYAPLIQSVTLSGAEGVLGAGQTTPQQRSDRWPTAK